MWIGLCVLVSKTWAVLIICPWTSNIWTHKMEYSTCRMNKVTCSFMFRKADASMNLKNVTDLVSDVLFDRLCKDLTQTKAHCGQCKPRIWAEIAIKEEPITFFLKISHVSLQMWRKVFHICNIQEITGWNIIGAEVCSFSFIHDHVIIKCCEIQYSESNLKKWRHELKSYS